MSNSTNRGTIIANRTGSCATRSSAPGVSSPARSDRSFRSLSVDEVRSTVEYEMAVSLLPNWTGQRQVRMAKLDGDQLVLATDRPSLFAGTM